MVLDQVVGGVAAAVRSAARDRHVALYIFGSYLHDPASACDLDVLVLYDEVDVPGQIREALSAADVPFPLHQMFLTFDEERHYQFVDWQYAVFVALSR